MKRIISLLILSIFSFPAFAQNEGKSVTLDEVTVKGAKVVSKVDGQMIFPTEAQKNASNNGYSLLSRLGLPNIRVDVVEHTITSFDGKGDVQIRINGIIVNKEEMLALDPKLISKIDYIDNPGVRYGEDVAFVINIITHRADSGYTLGIDITSVLTSFDVDGTLYGQWNTGKHQFSLSYNANAGRRNKTKVEEHASYTLCDGSIYHIERNDIEALQEGYSQNFHLTYNFADTTAYVFQVSLYDRLNNSPSNYIIRDITESKAYNGSHNIVSQYTARQENSSHGHTPWIDLYFSRQLTPRQSITANAVGTYMNKKESNYHDEGSPYRYDVNNMSVSSIEEVIYENQLKPFNLSVGMRHQYKHTENEYTDDVGVLTKMNRHNLYAFSEIKGVLKSFRYAVGIGTSYVNYTQGEHTYDFWTFRPKLTLAYNLMQGLQLRYTGEMRDEVSQVAMTNDAMIRQNSMEYTLGNPNLKPSRDLDQSLRLSYNDDRWSTFVEGFFRHCHKPNMAHYERTADDKFIYTQTNQKAINLLNACACASYWILPEKLQAWAYVGIDRFFNYGNDYTHLYSSWMYRGLVDAYLGNFTLSCSFDNGYRFLEGEKRVNNESTIALQCSYNYKNWDFALTYENPFSKNFKANETEVLNRNLHKLTTIYDRASGNKVSLSVSWRMTRGKKYKTADKTINLRDTDDGIMK